MDASLSVSYGVLIVAVVFGNGSSDVLHVLFVACRLCSMFPNSRSFVSCFFICCTMFISWDASLYLCRHGGVSAAAELVCAFCAWPLAMFPLAPGFWLHVLVCSCRFHVAHSLACFWSCKILNEGVSRQSRSCAFCLAASIWFMCSFFNIVIAGDWCALLRPCIFGIVNVTEPQFLGILFGNIHAFSMMELAAVSARADSPV